MACSSITQHAVLFVCLGNICRSPIAEGLFTHLIAQAGRTDEFMIDSAGTSGWHIGEPPDSDGQMAMRERGIDISRQRCRQLRARDFETFDLLIAMDDQNRRDLVAQAATAAAAQKVRLLMDYAPGAGAANVPDPWSCGPDAFAHVVTLIEAGCIGLLDSLPQTA